MLEITSNIMEINKNTLKESQNEGKALKRYSVLTPKPDAVLIQII